MSGVIDTLFVKQFNTTLQHLVQQKDSRFRGSVRIETNLRAEDAYYDQIAATSAVVRTTRHADVAPVATAYDRRRVSPLTLEVADYVDEDDKLKMLVDPTSYITQSYAAALNRGFDDQMITAIFGTAYTGKDGSTGTAWSAFTDQLVAHGSDGLTVNKLIAAKLILDSEEVPYEDRHCMISAKQGQDLLLTTQFTSADFNTVKALTDGRYDDVTWLGFRFHHSERLPTDTGSRRRVVCWQKDGLLGAFSKDIATTIDWLPQKQTYQVYAKMVVGCTRMEEKRIVEIPCVES